MARFWPKLRYNGRAMAREVFFYQCLWVTKFFLLSLVAPGHLGRPVCTTLAQFYGVCERSQPLSNFAKKIWSRMTLSNFDLNRQSFFSPRSSFVYLIVKVVNVVPNGFPYVSENSMNQYCGTCFTEDTLKYNGTRWENVYCLLRLVRSTRFFQKQPFLLFITTQGSGCSNLLTTRK